MHGPVKLRVRVRVGRVLALVLAGAMFVGIASIIKPAPRSAAADAKNQAVLDEFAAEMRDVFVSPVREDPTDPREAELVKRLKARKAAADAQTSAAESGRALLGTFQGREHMVKCFASPDGPRYSVYTLDGRVLQANLPADEVYRAFPDIDLSTLRADPPDGMLWDSAADWRD